MALFCCLLFLIAFLYASVGHGGASGYLALMALFSMTPGIMKPTALLLNLFVSLTSFIQFYRGAHFRWKLFWPFALASVPLAYLGGMVIVDGTIYKKILGFLLIIPILRFYFFANAKVDKQKQPSFILSLVIGGAIGFLSGLIGIGGGILLSPILLLLKWADQKQTAAVSALFIFVNSLSGLAGQLTKGIHFSPDMYLYVVIAFVGGLCGAYFGSLKFKQSFLKNVLATVLVLAAYKLLFTKA
ncbi:MAG: sulfite exporter TauE/SafE family protein [Flavisolibacter sp.]